MKTVVFDLDGTLADTSGDLLAAANAALGRAVLGPDDAATAFAGGRAMLRLGFARLGRDAVEAEVDRAFPILLAAYEAEIDRRTFLYPGVIAALKTLRARNYLLTICTNKPEGLAETLTRRLGIRDLFGALVGADSLPTRKPDAAPYRAAVERAGGKLAASFLLGDTVTDRDTARAVGVPVALVAFGPLGEGIRSLQPDAILQHFDDLPALADRLLF